MLLGLIICIITVVGKMDMSLSEIFTSMKENKLSQIFNTDVNAPKYFLKHILGGMFITIAMTGLDQEMMQKNISVRTLKDSQKNILTLSTILIFVNLLFLFMGALLYLYAAQTGVTVKGDDLFPSIALGGMLSVAVSIIFIIGLISALFPSADGALTALTSSFCIDILGLKKKTNLSEQQKRKTRLTVHFSFAIIFFLLVMIFKWIDDKSIIDVILKVAGYTYGPLLGLFAFGILTHRKIKDKYALAVCLLSPLIIFGIDLINNPDWYINHFNLSASTAESLKSFSHKLFGGFKMGIEILIFNGLVTFLGLFIISSKDVKRELEQEINETDVVIQSIKEK